MSDERDWIEGLLEQRDEMNAEATADPRDAEIARLRQDLARAEAMNRINVCGYCHAQFQRTEDGVRQLAQHILCCEKNPLAVALHRVADERDEARAQLAAAQADAVALRGALSDLFLLEGSCDILRLDGAREQAARALNLPPYAPLRPALAPPAPGAPLLDAVRRLVEAAEHATASHERAEARLRAVWGTDQDQVGAAYAEAMGEFDGSMAVVAPALAAVRAVLSRAQDTAGISRGGDG